MAAKRLTFLDKAPEAVLKDIIGYWQSISGRVLYPSQIENLEMHTLAYRESLLRQDIQFCAEQNLVEYAVGEHQDALGVMLACPRLQPTAAECRVKFTLDEPSPSGRSFPVGTRITTNDGKIAFETIAPCYVISTKTVSSEAVARCVSTGRDGNGLEGGVLCALDPALPGVNVENVTVSEGGSEIETDSAYRERLFMAASSIGCGGTFAGYRYWARSASPLVADAWPTKDGDGNIIIYILSQDGQPTPELLSLVQTSCNADNIRLINDFVITEPAIKQEYVIKAEITVYDTHDGEEALDRVNVLAHEYARRQRLKLGQDVTPTQLLMALSPVGECLYHVNLLEPSDIIKVGDNCYPEVTDIEITLMDVTHG